MTRSRPAFFGSVLAVTLWLSLSPSVAHAQKKTADLKAPDAGYVYPPGGKAGTTIDVQIAGYDWTPDLQYFVFDPRVKLETLGPPGPILVPPPPYWFGAKAYINALPLPREQPARLTLPADLPPGPVRWAVAGASGAGLKTGIFWVGSGPEVVEATSSKAVQLLPALPVTVSGRLAKVEEVDRYRFAVPKDGPVTCEVVARRLGVGMNAAVTVRDPAGRVVADAVDSDGNDLAFTFRAAAGVEYTAALHDLDFRGDRSFVYRLTLTPGPRVVATIPAAGKRGETRDVEVVGYGVATGNPGLESVTRKVTFPADPKLTAFAYRLETPAGTAPAFDIPLDTRAETVAAPGPNPVLVLPAAVTGVLDRGTAEAKFRCDGKKGDVWELAAEARRFGSPLDLSLAVVGPDGKELIRADDLPGTTDAGLSFTVPADGAYTLVVSDLSGRIGSRAAVYRLTAERATPGFTLATVARLNVPLDGKAELTVTAKRTGGFKGPISVAVAGLPEGVTVPPSLVIPADKPDVKIPLQPAAGAPAMAALVTVTGTADVGTGPLTRAALAPIPGNLATLHPDDERTASVLVATTLAPRLKLVAVEADGGRKVFRGSTHPSEVTVDRFDGFAGEVFLWMSAAQSYQRQGITGPELTVPPADAKAFYPCFMPEWLETTRTSRMELIGVIRVPDARGKPRYLVTPMSGRITMSIEGALLKLTHAARDVRLRPGDTAAVPVTILRSAKLTEPVKLELVVPDELVGAVTAEPLTVAPTQATAEFRVTCPKGAKAEGEYTFTIRGTALRDGKWRVVSETEVTAEFGGK